MHAHGQAVCRCGSSRFAFGGRKCSAINERNSSEKSRLRAWVMRLGDMRRYGFADNRYAAAAPAVAAVSFTQRGTTNPIESNLSLSAQAP
jgi:hypothetical protein